MEEITILKAEYDILVQRSVLAKRWEDLLERLVNARNNYTDEEWIDPAVRNEINADIRWIIELVTKYNINW